MSIKKWFSEVRKDYFVLIGATIVLLIVGAFQLPGFLTLKHQAALFRRNAIIGILALAQTMAILSGGIDLSVGANTTIVAVIGATFMGSWNSLLLPLLLVLVVGSLLGLINGIGIGYIGLPPIVMTLGVMTAVSGAALLWTGGSATGQSSPILRNFARGEIAGIPNLGLFWALLTVIIWFILNKTKFGREVRAFGSNPTSSFYSGLETQRITVLVYVFVGFIAAIAGLANLGWINTPYLGLAPAGIGMDLLLSSLAVVVIGGTTFRGGEGGVTGTFIATFLYGILRSLLTAMDLGSAGIRIVTGIIIVVVVIARKQI
ncbi:MAG: ABC transporter permease [Candidatus Bipolaricaulota bacterium]